MISEETHQHFMQQALNEAVKAAAAGEVPTGCVIVRLSKDPERTRGKIIARAHNQTELLKDATAHAEMLAITQASSAVGDWRLTDTVLYVTKEPCAMCAGAIILARIPCVVWGLSDPKRGGHSVFSILAHADLNHRPELIPDIMADECRQLFQDFFRTRRAEAR